MDPTDRFERKWRELRDEIKRRETDLEDLKRKFKTLDDARLVLIQMTPAGEAAAETIAQVQRDVSPRSLQEVALEYLRQSRQENGESVAEVARAIEGEFLNRYRNRNSFVASLFVTLKRLARQNRVRVIHKNGVRRYVTPDGTRNLFMPIQVKEAIIR